MSLPQHLTKGKGGTIYIDLPSLPDNAYVRVLQGDGTEQIGSVAATRSTINTTLGLAANAGDLLLNVSSNVGMAVGGKFWIQDDPEEVLIRKVSGANIYIRRPLLYAHVSGAACEGTRVSYAVNSTQADDTWWDGRAEWNIEGTSYQYSAVECTLYPLNRLASGNDITDIEPKFYYLVDSEQDVERLLNLGFEEVLKRIAEIAPDYRARVYTGSPEFITATALAALWFHYSGQAGPTGKEMADRYETRLGAEIKRIVPIIPRDGDQDGEIEADERLTPRSRKLSRG